MRSSMRAKPMMGCTCSGRAPWAMGTMCPARQSRTSTGGSARNAEVTQAPPALTARTWITRWASLSGAGSTSSSSAMWTTSG
jgi:N-acetylmuramic acid 6-phosphate (MurNAc-6-P) etherase